MCPAESVVLLVEKELMRRRSRVIELRCECSSLANRVLKFFLLLGPLQHWQPTDASPFEVWSLRIYESSCEKSVKPFRLRASSMKPALRLRKSGWQAGHRRGMSGTSLE